LTAKPAVIAITPRLGVSLHTDVPHELESSAYGVASRGWIGTTLYHADGRAHIVRALDTPPPLGLLRRLLAYTVYNPAVRAQVLYQTPRPYLLDQLREHLARAVHADDDILTQWHSEEDLIQRLRIATTYDDLLAVVRSTEGPAPDANDATCPD
jgi:hypothetical protein